VSPEPSPDLGAFPDTGIRLQGRLIGLFSFDVGAEIDLDRARRLAPATPGDRASRRAAPTYVGHTTPPLRASLGERPVTLADTHVTAEASAIIHEVGAITIVLTMPLACDAAALPALTATLTGAGPLEDVARRLAEEQRTRIADAITKAGPNDLLEDYYVIQVDQLDPAVTIPELLTRARAPLAAALRCEPAPLSETEVDDTLRLHLSYYPDDLAISDWNVTILVDPDPWATLDVLEFLNVQLLELRFFDGVLDRRLADSFGLTAMRARPWPLWNAALQRTIDELAAVRLEVASMVERLHNAFKVGGDVYLAKLYTRTAERLAIGAWEASVQAKLDVLHQRYALLIERMRAARSELLEVLIVVLIMIEIVLILLGHG
jgi:hypothetical protein